jgi:hypothetical protein
MNNKKCLISGKMFPKNTLDSLTQKNFQIYGLKIRTPI